MPNMYRPGPGPGPGRGPGGNGDLWYGYGDPIAQSDHKPVNARFTKKTKRIILLSIVVWLAIVVILALAGITKP